MCDVRNPNIINNLNRKLKQMTEQINYGAIEQLSQGKDII